jgi:hypothetical protein
MTPSKNPMHDGLRPGRAFWIVAILAQRAHAFLLTPTLQIRGAASAALPGVNSRPAHRKR